MLPVINIYVHTICSQVVILATRPKASRILSHVNNHGNLPLALSLRLPGTQEDCEKGLCEKGLCERTRSVAYPTTHKLYNLYHIIITQLVSLLAY